MFEICILKGSPLHLVRQILLTNKKQEMQRGVRWEEMREVVMEKSLDNMDPER